MDELIQKFKSGEVFTVENSGTNVIETDDRTAEYSQPTMMTRPASTGAFTRYTRPTSLPQRASKGAYQFHYALASTEIEDRKNELARIIAETDPVCDYYEDNPFKKGICRLCKHLKSEHADPFEDVMDDLEAHDSSDEEVGAGDI